MPTFHPTCSYDTALPQLWVESLITSGFDPRGIVVWAYPEGFLMGCPYPLSPIAAHKLLSHTQSADFLLRAWVLAGLPPEIYPAQKVLASERLDTINHIS